MKVTKGQLRQIIREAMVTAGTPYSKNPIMEQMTSDRQPAEKDMKAAGLSENEISQMWAHIEGTTDEDFMSTPMYEKLYNWFAFDGPVRMPYGTAKARDGDPVEWILDYLEDPSGY